MQRSHTRRRRIQVAWEEYENRNEPVSKPKAGPGDPPLVSPHRKGIYFWTRRMNSRDRTWQRTPWTLVATSLIDYELAFECDRICAMRRLLRRLQDNLPRRPFRGFAFQKMRKTRCTESPTRGYQGQIGYSILFFSSSFLFFPLFCVLFLDFCCFFVGMRG